MNPADEQLVQLIRQVTHGGSRMLVTLARRGKGLEREDPERAASLLASVRNHPLYKGGRLTFDMLEIEDLMLDGAPVELMSLREVIQVLNAGTENLARMLRLVGSPPQGMRPPGQERADGTDVPDGSVHARTQSTEELAAAGLLPRVSVGPDGGTPHETGESRGSDRGSDWRNSAPELLASDYLYDYVVLGWLDVAGAVQKFLR